MFDPRKAKLIVEAILLGMEPDRAALAYGVPVDEHHRWLDTATPDADSTELVSLEHAGYARAVETAVARAELSALQRVLHAGGDADAHRWLLERRFPDRWAKTPAAARTAQLKRETDNPESEQAEDDLARARREREERRAGNS